MKSRGSYRRHSTPFKLRLCQDIRNGVIGRRESQIAMLEPKIGQLTIELDLVEKHRTCGLPRQQEILLRYQPTPCFVVLGGTPQPIALSKTGR